MADEVEGEAEAPKDELIELLRAGRIEEFKRRMPRGIVDLRGADLRDVNLRGVDLSSADLSGANLRFADLGDANLLGVVLSDADLSGADLSGANLSSADLTGVRLIRVNLRNANLRNAILGDVILGDVGVPHARNTILLDTNLSGADLRGTGITEADAHGRRGNYDKHTMFDADRSAPEDDREELPVSDLVDVERDPDPPIEAVRALAQQAEMVLSHAVIHMQNGVWKHDEAVEDDVTGAIDALQREMFSAVRPTPDPRVVETYSLRLSQYILEAEGEDGILRQVVDAMLAADGEAAEVEAAVDAAEFLAEELDDEGDRSWLLDRLGWLADNALQAGGGALTGSGVGALAGGPLGAGVGAVLGLLLAILSTNFKGRPKR